MTDEERLEKINTKAVSKFHDFLLQLENDEISEEDMVSIAYAAMLVVYVLGFSPEDMAADATRDVQRLLNLIEAEPIVVKCKNKDENGNCPLHNLHCQYPDCEKELTYKE